MPLSCNNTDRSKPELCGMAKAAKGGAIQLGTWRELRQVKLRSSGGALNFSNPGGFTLSLEASVENDVIDQTGRMSPFALRT